MGFLFSKLWSVFSSGDHKVLVLGLDNAGKSTIVYQLIYGKVVETVPTIGGNVEEFQCENIKFVMWDVGGQDTLRSNWSVYFQNTEVLMFVIDSTDENRLHIAKSELWNVLSTEQFKGCLLVVLANKQDCTDPPPLSAAEISTRLNLTTLRSEVKSWTIQPCSAISREGLNEAVTWITKHIKTKPS